jgi:hypothetical protein
LCYPTWKYIYFIGRPMIAAQDQNAELPVLQGEGD